MHSCDGSFIGFLLVDDLDPAVDGAYEHLLAAAVEHAPQLVVALALDLQEALLDEGRVGGEVFDVHRVEVQEFDDSGVSYYGKQVLLEAEVEYFTFDVDCVDEGEVVVGEAYYFEGFVPARSDQDVVGDLDDPADALGVKIFFDHILGFEVDHRN